MDVYSVHLVHASASTVGMLLWGPWILNKHAHVMAQAQVQMKMHTTCR